MSVAVFDQNQFQEYLHTRERLDQKEKAIDVQQVERAYFERQAHALERFLEDRLRTYFGDRERGTIGSFDRIVADYERTKSHLLKKELKWIADNLIPYQMFKLRQAYAEYEERKKPENLKRELELLNAQRAAIREIQATLSRLKVHSTSNYIH